MPPQDAVIQARKHWHISDDYDCRFEIHEEKVDKTTGQRRLRRFVLSDCVWGEYDDVHLVKSLKYVPGDEERIKAEKIVKAAQPTPGPMTPASERQDTPPSRRAPAPCSPVGEKILELPEEQEEDDDDIIIPATPEASDVEDVEDAAPTASKGKGKGRAQERTASRETLAALADGEDVGELVDGGGGGGASGSSRSSSQRSVEADRRHSSSQSKSGSTASTGSQPLPAPTVAVPLASTSRPPHDLASVAASTSTFHTAPENDEQRSSSRSPAPSPIPKPTPPVEDGNRRWSGNSSASWAVGLVNGEIGYVAVSKGSGDPSLTQQTSGSEPIDELIEIDAEPPVKASPSIAEDADAEMLIDTSEEPASSKEGHIFKNEVVSSPVIPAAARQVHSSAPKRQPKPTPSSDATSPAFPPPSGKRKVSESASQSSPRRVKVTFAVEVPPSPVASTSRIASASTHQSSSNVSPPKSRIPSASQPQPPISPTYSFVDSSPRISHSQPTPAKPPRKPRASQSKTATNRDTSERPSPPSRPRSGRETRAKFWFRLPNHK